MGNRTFAFLKRLAIVNLAVVAVALIVVLELNELFPYYYQCLLLHPYAIAMMLGVGFLAGGLAYVEESPFEVKIKYFLIGWLLGVMAGAGIFILNDWLLFTAGIGASFERLYSLLLLLVMCVAPQFVQLLISKHKKVLVVVSLLVTAILLVLIYEVMLMLNPNALYDFSFYIVMSLMPSVIVITQALVARALPR